jgi:sugar lactone lactonase YvrE
LQSMTVDKTETTIPVYGSSITYRPQDGTFVSAHDDGIIRIWDAHFHQLTTLPFFGQQINALTFAPDGKTVFTSAWLYTQTPNIPQISFWDVPSALRGAPNLQTLLQTNDSANLAVSPDGKELASAGGYFNPTITLWQLDQQTQQSISVPGNGVLDVAFSRDGQWIAGSTAEGMVKLWDAATGDERLMVRDNPRVAIGYLNFSPNGHWLAASYGSADGKQAAIEFYDVQASLNAGKGVLDHTLSWSNRYTSQVPFVFSSDGRLATIGADSVKIWDVAKQNVVVTIDKQFSVNALAFSPDGHLLATTTTNGINDTVLLWNADTGKQVAALNGHTATINALAFNNDGTLLASGSSDGTARLWGLEMKP